MKGHNWCGLAITAVLALLNAGVAGAAESGATTRPTAGPTIPLETLRSVFLNLHKAASAAESGKTAAAVGGALQKYRKMQQMLDRYSELKVEPSYKKLLADKIQELQAQTASLAKQEADRERAERAARAARARAGGGGGFSLPTISAGGGYSGGAAYTGGGGGSVSRGGGVACPPARVPGRT